jgi:hypothetical protein
MFGVSGINNLIAQRSGVSVLEGSSKFERHCNRWRDGLPHAINVLSSGLDSERHGIALSLALGELRASDAVPSPSDASDLLETWAADQIIRSKRRADVAGQYGPKGFVLLLVHAPEQGAPAFCQRLQCLLEQSPGTASGPPIAGRVPFGVAGYCSMAFTPKMLLRRAEEQLDHMKTMA